MKRGERPSVPVTPHCVLQPGSGAKCVHCTRSKAPCDNVAALLEGDRRDFVATLKYMTDLCSMGGSEEDDVPVLS